jgi:uncharacterized RmlC-like cupin family protein
MKECAMTALELPPTRPTVVGFDTVEPFISTHGHRTWRLIDGHSDGSVPGYDDGCAGGIVVAPAFVAYPHRHRRGAIVTVVDCGDEGVVTLWGDNLDYAAPQRRGQVLVIPGGWAHTVVNLSLKKRAVAIKTTPNSSVLDDIERLPNLVDRAHTRAFELLLERHGHDGVTADIGKDWPR